MGKKPQKTKELSVAIAEASTTIDETGQQQSQTQITQPQAPRKRGRPRKIIEKMESEEEKTQPIEQPEASIATTQGTESTMEKVKANEESSSSASASACITKQEEIQPKSRARRKSKPRKSS